MTASAARPTVTVCGLGPGADDLLTERTIRLLEGPGPKFLRTARHPSAARVPDAYSFDSVYDNAESFTAVYRTITERLAAAAKEHGRVLYCVPGSPLVLERSVMQLKSRLDLDIELVPAISFLDEVWSRLDIDPVEEGVRLVDGNRFSVESAGERGPLVVAHVHAQWVLSEIKLALLENGNSGDQRALVLQRLGTADELIVSVAYPDLDRTVEADHLTTLYLPQLASAVGSSLLGSVELMRRLRAECPWDRSQDHGSLRRYLLEEAYEVIDVLDRLIDRHSGDQSDLLGLYEELESELGDLWLQILFHAQLASEAGQFDVSDVAQALIDKMVSRHPHVFGREEPSLFSRAETSIDDPTEVEAQWDQVKSEQSQRESVLDGVPLAMPPLARASKLVNRAVSGLGTPQLGTASMVGDIDLGHDSLGDLLLGLVEVSRRAGLNPESALRNATSRFEAQVRALESENTATQGSDAGPGVSWVIG